MLQLTTSLSDFDPELWSAIQQEAKRQEDYIELIASENYASPRVLQAQGSVLTNKYAEGYPHKRYYGGCDFVDQAEDLAIARAKRLFDADYVNVQPHSGSQANAAVYQALLSPGDSFLGMDLSHGGHLTHGSPVNFSGKHYQAFSYGLTADGQDIDYDQVADLARKHRPKLIIAGFSAFSRVIDWARFRAIADEVGAYLMADMAHVAGLVAAKLYPSPLPHAHVVTTTTHKTLRGPRGGMILSNAEPELTKRFNSAIFPGSQGGPLMHVIAAKAVAFQEALQDDFVTYQKSVIAGARLMAKTLSEQGFHIVTGGTDNHMFLVDLSDRDMTGKDAEALLEQAHITLNKNTVPNEKRSPFVTSGLRIGTPAVVTRGMGEQQISQIANAIVKVLNNPHSVQEVAEEITTLCRAFPVYTG